MEMSENVHKLESEVRSYSRSFPAVFKRAKGSYLYDSQGNRYIDFLAGAGALNYGHNPESIKQCVLDYLSDDGIVHGLDMNTAVRDTFLTTFESVILKPRKMTYKIQFPGPTGTNSVEAAIKLARKIKQRETILSFKNGFHGMTFASVSVTGNRYYHQVDRVKTRNPFFLPFDTQSDRGKQEAVSQLKKSLANYILENEVPAAIIVESVQGEGGINVASDEWLRGLQDVCQSHDIFLIVDDIQAGCGRTGRFFGFESSGIMPDMVLLSKSISGFGLPLSMVLMKPELDQWEPGEYSGTFRSNNLSLLTATKALQEFWASPEFETELATKSRNLAVSLTRLQSRYSSLIQDVRGKGMMWGVEFSVAEHAKAVSTASFGKGLIIETCGDQNHVLKLLPPLTIDNATLQKGLDILTESLDELASSKSSSPGASLDREVLV